MLQQEVKVLQLKEKIFSYMSPEQVHLQYKDTKLLTVKERTVLSNKIRDIS